MSADNKKREFKGSHQSFQGEISLVRINICVNVRHLMKAINRKCKTIANNSDSLRMPNPFSKYSFKNCFPFSSILKIEREQKFTFLKSVKFAHFLAIRNLSSYSHLILHLKVKLFYFSKRVQNVLSSKFIWFTPGFIIIVNKSSTFAIILLGSVLEQNGDKSRICISSGVSCIRKWKEKKMKSVVNVMFVEEKMGFIVRMQYASRKKNIYDFILSIIDCLKKNKPVLVSFCIEFWIRDCYHFGVSSLGCCCRY